MRLLWSTRDPQEMVRRALTHLRKGVANCKAKGQKPAAVFDVDETLLFNHPASGDHRVAVNGPVREVYDWCAANGVDAYIITARVKSPWSSKLLQNQLQALDYSAKKVYMVPKAYKDDADPSMFKARARERLRDRHKRTILINVGDQLTDHVETGRRQVVPATRADTFYGMLDVKDHPAMLSVKLPEE
jgi:predicted secreted acid phosphatase